MLACVNPWPSRRPAGDRDGRDGTQRQGARAALGVDAYLAGLVHRREELAEQEARAVAIARTCGGWVVFASFAGPTGDVFSETAGSSAIWSPDGTAVARAGPEVGGIARSAIG